VGIQFKVAGQKAGSFSGETDAINLKTGQVLDIGDWK
jgi:hypothetical protein